MFPEQMEKLPRPVADQEALPSLNNADSEFDSGSVGSRLHF